MTKINRRVFIGGAAFTLAQGILPALSDERHIYASTRKNGNGIYSASVFDIQIGDIASVELPARGHDMTINYVRQEAVAFARRPGDFAVVLSYGDKRQPLWIKSGTARHFYGHGVFSRDGKLLYSTENDFENGFGVIGIRDTANRYKKIGELSTYGIGPHDINLLPDGRTLVVANGGMRTHPETGYQILNHSEMEPSLVYIDSKDGNLRQKITLGKKLHQLSIRHLDVARDGTVIFGCKFKGPSYQRPPLVGFHRWGENNATMVMAPEAQHVTTSNYISSVSCDSGGTIAATTSSRGGLVTFWEVGLRRYLGARELIDVSGVAPGYIKSSFLLTTGRGGIEPTEVGSMLVPHPTLLKYDWDNHLVRL